MEELEKIVDQLIAETTAKNLAVEQKIQLRDQLVIQLNQQIGVAILGALSEQNAKQYIELMQTQANPAALEAFFKSALPNIQEVVEGAVEAYVGDYLAAQAKYS